LLTWWWPMLDSQAQAWLIAHNGEAISPDVLDKIVIVGGSAQQAGAKGTDGNFLPDEAVHWIEAKAND
jgi:hypothetical protein